MNQKISYLLATAVRALGFGVAAQADAGVLCGPGETLDKGRCLPADPGSAVIGPRATTTTTTLMPTTTTTTVPPIRTINEGQSTTFTAPSPQNRQGFYCSPATTVFTTFTSYVDGVPFTTTVSKTRKGGAYHLPPGEERTSDEPFTCGTGSARRTYGICQGPYTVELGSRDSRVQVASGNRRIKVSSSTSDNLDDTGTVEIGYWLHGTRTKVSAQDASEPDVTTTEACTLREDVTVKIRHASRPGMTAAVSRHAPAQEYLDTPSTTEWTCTQDVIDAGVPCPINTVISTTVQPTFPTPRGCRVVVTVAKNGKGFGSTGCLTSAQIGGFEAEIAAEHPDDPAIDVSTLPACPDSTHTDAMNALPTDASGRKRCVARN